jgi:hypothetical protein
LCALTAAGCGATATSDADAVGDPDFADQATGESSIETLEEPLGANESCATLGPNKTTSGWPADYVSPSVSGKTGCTSAYRVDANGYFGYDSTTDPREVNWVGYSGPTRNDCGRMRFGIYVWKEGTYVGNAWVWGTNRGIGGVVGCYAAIPIVPQFDLTDAAVHSNPVSVGFNFRFAMSARFYAVAGNSASAFVSRPIHSWTAQRAPNDF